MVISHRIQEDIPAETLTLIKMNTGSTLFTHAWFSYANVWGTYVQGASQHVCFIAFTAGTRTLARALPISRAKALSVSAIGHHTCRFMGHACKVCFYSSYRKSAQTTCHTCVLSLLWLMRQSDSQTYI